MGRGDPSDQRNKVQRVSQYCASADVVICLVDPAQYPDLVSIALHRSDIVWYGPSKYEQTSRHRAPDLTGNNEQRYG